MASMALFNEKPPVNQLYDGIDKTKIVMGITCPRKKMRRHGIQMNEDGSCPIEGCGYLCKSLKQSTFAMHITRKHQFITGNSTFTYTCETCYRTFSSRSIMNNHQEREHGGWKYTCKEVGCSKMCPNVASLMVHHVAIHLKMKGRDCVDENGCCLNCEKKLGKSGYQYHYATCIGLRKRLDE